MGENFPGKPDKSILYSKPMPRTMPGTGGGSILPQAKGIIILSVVTPDMIRNAVSNAIKGGAKIDDVLNILYDFKRTIDELFYELAEAKEDKDKD